jgi:hypothetical protein
MLSGPIVEELQQAADEYLQRQHENGGSISQPISDASAGVRLRQADEGRELLKRPLPLFDLLVDRT